MMQNKKIVIGVTGGVGSGKTAVCNTLAEEVNAKLLIADDMANQLMLPGGLTYHALIDAFGKDIVRKEDGYIDRKLLADRVFASGGSTETINKIVHPIVIDQIKKEIAAFRYSTEDNDNTSEFLVIEAALLLDTDIPELCDRMWYVFAPESVRISRLVESRGYSVEKCHAIIDKQRSTGEFFAAATDVIPTGYGFKVTAERIRQLIAELRG